MLDSANLEILSNPISVNRTRSDLSCNLFVGVAEDWDTYFHRTLKSPGSFLGSLVLHKKITMMKKGLDVVWLITLSFTSEEKIFASPSMLRPFWSGLALGSATCQRTGNTTRKLSNAKWRLSNKGGDLRKLMGQQIKTGNKTSNLTNTWHPNGEAGYWSFWAYGQQ
jgi:hypothetical protein